jgi:hypothetical protein
MTQTPDDWPPPEFWPPEDLANLDTLDAIQKGQSEPPPDEPSPHDAETKARLQIVWPYGTPETPLTR